MSKVKKQQAFLRGNRAEKWAMLYLWLKGYKILKRRFKTKVGEIDIIASKPGLIVFVEVKARDTYEDAAYSITPKQKQRIINAAKSYYMENPSLSEFDMRFDAILILPKKLPINLKGCWRPDE